MSPEEKEELAQLVKENSYNPLETYTQAQVAKLLHTGRSKVEQLERFGLLEGRKMGKAKVFSADEIQAFLAETKGADLSNITAIQAFVERRNKA